MFIIISASYQLDKLILELEQKPLPEPEDIEYLNSLDQEVKQKEQGKFWRDVVLSNGLLHFLFKSWMSNENYSDIILL